MFLNKIFGVALFYYFYTEMLCAGCGSHHLELRAIYDGTKSAKFYSFCATLLILHTTAMRGSLFMATSLTVY